MKNKIKKAKVFLYALLTFCACSCTDYLDVVPDNVATVDYAFRDRVSAEKYLYTCYNYIPTMGNPTGDPAIMGDDGTWSHEDPLYYPNVGNFLVFRIKEGFQNSNDPLLNPWEGRNNAKDLYRAIRDCNVFLENIDKVGADLPYDERIRWKAEVKVLKAFYHYYLMRHYGPIPLIRENFPVSAHTEEIWVYRDTFDDCVDYVVDLIDEAAPDLPPSVLDRGMELGRITRAVALCIKAEALVMAASDLFNGNPDFADLKDNRDVYLFKPNEDPQKWVRAAVACRDAIELCHEEGVRLYRYPVASAYTLSDSTRQVMTIRHVMWEKWNSEMIWASSIRSVNENHQRHHLPFFTTEENARGQGRPIINPTLRMAELYYSKRGVPIEEDEQYDYANRYRTAPAPEDHKYYVQPGFETARLHLNREPRFYASLGFDGGVWFGNGRYKDVGKGNADETSWIMRMKKGEASGNFSGIRFSITGYYVKKSAHFETARNSTGTTLTYVNSSYPFIRLADLYLLYSEALNETLNTPNEEVCQYVDSVRLRAGLEGVRISWEKYSRNKNKPFTKEGMREIIRQERMIELAFEGKRFWDIRRWKIAADLMNQPIKGWNINSSSTAEYYNVVTIAPISFTTKEYLWPIRDAELRINKNLVQNPGW